MQFFWSFSELKNALYCSWIIRASVFSVATRNRWGVAARVPQPPAPCLPWTSPVAAVVGVAMAAVTKGASTPSGSSTPLPLLHNKETRTSWWTDPMPERSACLNQDMSVGYSLLHQLLFYTIRYIYNLCLIVSLRFVKSIDYPLN